MTRNNADKHHLLSTRAAWTSHPDGKWLREQPSLIRTLERDVHETIHKECPAVPLLGYQALHIVRGLYEPRETVLGSIDALTMAIQQAEHARGMHHIDSRLCQLAIQAIRLQIPYLKGNTMEDWA